MQHQQVDYRESWFGKSIPNTGISVWCTNIAQNMWYLRSLERTGVIPNLTILKRKKWSSIDQYYCTSVWDL